MTEEELKELAKQLRKPEGEIGIEIAKKLNESNRLINEKTIEALNIKPGEHILELGMGNGFFVKKVLEYGDSVTYTGCDISELMVAESEKMNRQFIEAGRASFHLMSESVLPMEDQVIDSIFTVNTLYFWEDTTAMFAELKRVLKKDGKLAIAVRPQSTMVNYGFVKYGFEMYARNDLVELVEKNDLEVLEVLDYKDEEIVFDGELVRVDSLIIIGKSVY